MSSIPIFVAGPPRSGTSLVSRLLAEHGVWIGDCIEADKHNKMGYYENKKMVDVLKRFLKSNGISARSDSIPPKKWWYNPEDFREQFECFVPEEVKFWLFKDSKILLAWDFFEYHFPEAIWVLPYRGVRSITASLMNHDTWRRRLQKKQSGHRSIKKKPKHFHKMIHDLYRAQYFVKNNARGYFVSTSEIINNYKEAKTLIENCGITFNRAAYDRAVVKDLWHHGG